MVLSHFKEYSDLLEILETSEEVKELANEYV